MVTVGTEGGWKALHYSHVTVREDIVAVRPQATRINSGDQLRNYAKCGSKEQ